MGSLKKSLEYTLFWEDGGWKSTKTPRKTLTRIKNTIPIKKKRTLTRNKKHRYSYSFHFFLFISPPPRNTRFISPYKLFQPLDVENIRMLKNAICSLYGNLYLRIAKKIQPHFTDEHFYIIPVSIFNSSPFDRKILRPRFDSKASFKYCIAYNASKTRQYD